MVAGGKAEGRHPRNGVTQTSSTLEGSQNLPAYLSPPCRGADSSSDISNLGASVRTCSTSKGGNLILCAKSVRRIAHFTKSPFIDKRFLMISEWDGEYWRQFGRWHGVRR